MKVSFSKVLFLLFLFSVSGVIVLAFFVEGRAVLSDYAVFFLSYFSALFLLIGLTAFLYFWIAKKQHQRDLDRRWKLFELSLPDNFHRTAEAMERVFDGLSLNTGEGDVYSKYWLGSTRPFYSVEICASEGSIKMFIRVEDFFAKYLVPLFYSYYPEVELREVDDYVETTSLEEGWDVWAANFKTNKFAVEPIRTYPEFEKKMKVSFFPDTLERKREYLDSLAPLIELLSQVSLNEQIWLQIIFRNYKDDTITDPNALISMFSFKDTVKAKLKKLKGEENKDAGKKMISEGDKDMISRIESKSQKPKFEVGIRGMYLAKQGYFQPRNIVAMISAFKHFQTENTNKIIPTGGHVTISDPWKPVSENIFRVRKRGTTAARISKWMFNSYRRRDYFYPIYRYPVSVLSSEELATLFHPLDTDIIKTIAVSKTAARKIGPPSNLPV